MFVPLLQLSFLTLAAGVALPCGVFGSECCLARPAAKVARAGRGRNGRATVVVPAHDEAAGISPTIRGLLDQLAADDRLIVVADNCTDDTSVVAREAGAHVLERNDPKHRGKGYAISFAVEHLRDDPPDVLVIVDADCQLGPGALDALVEAALGFERPVQADYLLEVPSDRSSPGSRLSAFAVLVRNRVRPLGLHRLGLPSQLTGSGMAFPWQQIAQTRSMGGNIVEDLALGLELALAGHAPRFCPDAVVRSSLPDGERASQTQRRRWETGQLSTLAAYAPRLLGRGLLEGRRDLLALGLDLSVPPLALLTLLEGASLVLTFGLGWTLGTWLPFGVATAGAVSLGTGLVVAFRRFGRETLSTGDLLGIPLYVARKVGLYTRFFTRGQEREWVRTDRGQK